MILWLASASAGALALASQAIASPRVPSASWKKRTRKFLRPAHVRRTFMNLLLGLRATAAEERGELPARGIPGKIRRRPPRDCSAHSTATSPRIAAYKHRLAPPSATP